MTLPKVSVIRLLANGYTMEGFDDVLYIIPRRSFREFFKQAMAWNYGLVVASLMNSLLLREYTIYGSAIRGEMIRFKLLQVVRKAR